MPPLRFPGFVLLLGFGGAFGFGRGLCLPFVAAFAVLWAWGWSFPGCVGLGVALSARTHFSPSEVYPADKLQ